MRVLPPESAASAPIEIDEVVLDLTDEVQAGGEEGLIGLAFDPSGELAYLHYSRASDARSVTPYRTPASTTWAE